MRPIALLFSAILCLSAQADLVISEFLASNSGTSLLDEDGDSSDWIEIHNTGESPESLGGYFLTDDETDLTQWAFPAVSIPSGGYIIVFASSKDRSPVPGELHTNFKLSASGEFLALLSPSQDIVYQFAPIFPAQEEDISYGVGPDGSTLGFFISPTPGSANSVSSAGRVKDTEFSINRGIFSDPVSVVISTATETAQIRYTKDGSTPTATHGFIYNNSTPISITGTTTLRAAAFKTGLFPTNVDTHTYLFPSDVRTQFSNGTAPAGWPTSEVNGQVYDYGMDPDITGRYSAAEMETALKAIPSVMLTTDIPNLTDASTGIYSNPNGRGIAWERPAHFEILNDGEDPQVSVRCGLRIRGGASRNPSNPKHAFRLFFRDDYGASSLDYPMFETEGVDEFKKIDLRTAQNYSWSKDGNAGSNTFLREVVARDLQAATGQPYTRSRYYHVYLNGIYWGLFMTQERSEANWGASYLGGNDDDFDTLKSAGSSGGYNTEATDGDLNGDWRELWDLARAQNSNPSTTLYYQMQGLDSSGQRDPSLPVLLDVDNLIDYMMIIGFTGSYDSALSSFVGASNNWYSVRNSVRGDRGFVHLVHDAEHSLGAGGRWNSNNDRMNTENGADKRDVFSKSNPQFIHIDIAESTPEYRLRFADRAHAALFNNGYLTKNRVLALLEARRQVVDQVIIAESARWGDVQDDDPSDKENWEGAVSNLEALFDTRTQDFLGHLKMADLYPETDAPTFSPFTQFVAAGSDVQIAGNEGTIYYTTDGSDPRSPNGAPNPDAQAAPTGSLSAGGFGKNSVWSYDDSGTNRLSSDIVSGAPGYDSSNWKHPDFNSSAWPSGAGVFGFGELGSNSNAITTAMGEGSTSNGSNPTTCYLRRSFTVTDVSTVQSISSSILADDGPIVYINGVEVYRSNFASSTINYSDTAENAIGGNSELNYTPFTFSPSLLVEGANVIAVEIHQVNTTSSDIGFDLELSVQQPSELTSLPIYTSTQLKARALNGGEWSALTSNYYSTSSSPEPGDLLISEVHYHPSNPSSPSELAVSTDDGDYEFIELTNISNKDLELVGVNLAEQVINDHLEGVRFTFPQGLLMPPGMRLVIVANQEAFQARYPGTPSSAIAGQFNGNLGNSGEWLQLRNAQGTIIASFRYNDVAPWPTEADGAGKSLQLTNLISTVDYSDPLAWMAIIDQGTPGLQGPGAFTGVPSDDLDNDGIPALIEYFSGSSDSQSGAGNRPTLSTADGLLFSFTRDPETYGITSAIEQSYELGFWSSPPAGAVLVSRETLSNNLIRETYRIATSPLLEPSTFVRLRVEQVE